MATAAAERHQQPADRQERQHHRGGRARIPRPPSGDQEERQKVIWWVLRRTGHRPKAIAAQLEGFPLAKRALEEIWRWQRTWAAAVEPTERAAGIAWDGTKRPYSKEEWFLLKEARMAAHGESGTNRKRRRRKKDVRKAQR